MVLISLIKLRRLKYYLIVTAISFEAWKETSCVMGRKRKKVELLTRKILTKESPDKKKVLFC